MAFLIDCDVGEYDCDVRDSGECCVSYNVCEILLIYIALIILKNYFLQLCCKCLIITIF